jgi:hypothetical protein
MFVVVEKLAAKVLRWGNSLGLRISRHDADAIGLKEGDEVVITVVPPRQRVDLSHLKTFDFGGDLSDRHDDVEWA